MQPANPVAAATHPDPYPYYDALLKWPALLFAPSLNLWVASRSAVLREVFEHPDCATAARHGWVDQDLILANLIGLLAQTHEASAGLIGNTIVAVLRRPELQAQLINAPQQIDALVQEVARCDPSVQNTRRGFESVRSR